MYPVNFVHTGRLRRCVFCRGAGTSAHSAESHRDLRADRREGRAERRNSVYYSNGVTNASAVSIFRRHAAPIFRGSTSARSRQADAARPRLGRHCEPGWIHSHCQPRRCGRGGNHGGTWHRASQIQGKESRHRPRHRRGVVEDRRENSASDCVCR